MKRGSSGNIRWNFVWPVAALLIVVARSTIAAPLQEATIAHVVGDVQLLVEHGALHPALINENVGEGTTVLTGGDSRAELIFADQTVARLGASTIFSFKGGSRNLSLVDGAVLLQVPKGVNGAKIQSPGVTAAISGITGMFEYHPGVYKFLVLEGTGRLYRHGHLGDSLLVKAGQMVIGNPSFALSDPVDFDIGRFLKTSRFIIDFPSLRSETLMADESQKQQREKSKKALIKTNLVIFGGGTRVSLVDPRYANAIDRVSTASQAPKPTPAPTSGAISPSKEQISQ